MKREPENENDTTDNIQTCTGKYAQANMHRHKTHCSGRLVRNDK